MAIWWIIGGVIVIVAGMFFAYYNKFVRLTNQIDNSLAQIDVQLKRRSDLIPNLMESVKGYMKHEKSVMTEVTEARKALVGAKDLSKKIKAGDQLQNALGHLFAIAENYPNLKANETFLQLQQELSSTEDKVAYARQYYNDGILSYNTSRQTIPGKWFASMYGFGDKKYLEISAAERVVPKVKFD
ncbi:LemA family protein [Candidatus Pacearchaeota archaeon]|nr:LemA family protein [Candidatus Pacearchaeota archaeon]